MTTIAEIRDSAVAKVKAKITDAFISATLLEPTQGAYSTATGTSTPGETIHETVDILFQTETPIERVFPDLVDDRTPEDGLVLVISNTEPNAGWKLRTATKDYRIIRSQDILGNGTMFNVMVRGEK